jgi:polyisoprenoid-binding protein YceI
MMTLADNFVFRRVILFGLLGFLVLSQPNTVLSMSDFAIDPDRSSIIFRVKHLGITFVYGRFNHVTGRYVSPNGGAEKAGIDIHARVAGIDTGNVIRDNHLRSPDFFHAEKYPWIRFTSVSIESLDAESFRVVGDLSFHGVTRRITVEAFHTGSREDAQGGSRTGFQTIFTISRSDYGMKYMLGGIGDRVELTVSVEGVQKPLT